MVCDLDVLRDMMSMDVFSGRGKPTVMGINIFANMKGGHGGYGLVTSEGQSVCGGQIQNPTLSLGRTCDEAKTNTQYKGPSINDVRKILGFFSAPFVLFPFHFSRD